MELTVASAVAAVLVALFAPSPAPLPMERLFETFLSFSAAGFFSILGLQRAAASEPAMCRPARRPKTAPRSTDVAPVYWP